MKTDKIRENKDLHGTLHLSKSRSTAGVFGQTREANLVVSALVGQNLLSSKLEYLD